MSPAHDQRIRWGRPRRVRPWLRAEALEDRRLPSVTLNPVLVQPIEGAPFSGVVATFTSNDPAPQSASNYSATLTFGDMTLIAGTITAVGGGVFDVATSTPHTFTEEGGSTIAVTVRDAVDGSQSSSNAGAAVVDAPLTAQGATVTGAPGVPLSGLVASFTDTDPNGMASDDTATIDWGDGTTTAGTIAAHGNVAIGLSFTVTGGHVYAVQGHYPVVVTIQDTGGSAVVAAGQAVVTPTPPRIAGTGAAVTATAGTPVRDQPLVGFAGDPVAADYRAEINWGDGMPPSLGTFLPSGPAAGNGFTVVGGHTFVAPGIYNGAITVQAINGAAATVPLVSTVFAPTVSQRTLAAVEDQPLNQVQLATLAAPTGAPAIAPNFYTATIDFGDGTAPVPGVITPAGTVVGSHTYAESGSYTVRITIGTPGNPVVATSTVVQPVQDVPISLSGFLDPASDTGVSNSDNITKDNTPTFLGNSEPGSVIALFAQPVGSTAAPALIGGGVTDAGGIWRVTSLTLPDGDFTIVAMAVDRNGKTMATTQLLPQGGSGPLVIDTVGPKVTDLVFDRQHGRIGIAFQDDHSGLDQTSLIDGANYSFTGTSVRGSRRAGPFLVTSLAVSPPTGPTAPQAVTLTVNGGRPIPGGRYVLTVRSGGIEDVAGNALDGEFYGFFPSGNNKPGGDFVAGLDAVHSVVFSPLPIQNGFATPLNPPGTPGSSLLLTPPRRGTRSQPRPPATQPAAHARRPTPSPGVQHPAAAHASPNGHVLTVRDLAPSRPRVSRRAAQQASFT